MATSYGATPVLRLKRSTQSGEKAMTAAWQTVYEETASDAFLMWNGIIDLSEMQAGDIINIRFSHKSFADGDFVVYDQAAYNDAQPTEHKKIKIGDIASTHGARIEMQQTAGVLRDIYCEFYDAKRLGAG
jgi:hypothetical protein